jgi:hypothetical protein
MVEDDGQVGISPIDRKDSQTRWIEQIIIMMKYFFGGMCFSLLSFHSLLQLLCPTSKVPSLSIHPFHIAQGIRNTLVI